jgi:serine/threonine-protein kinase
MFRPSNIYMSHPQRLGKYLVTDVLGKGAMGVVYKAHDPDIQRTVAIKTIRRELVEDDDRAGMVMARFKNEARAAGRLSHPGIVAVYDYGEAEDVAFIAMEFVEGNSLRAYFSRDTQFEERDVVSLMAQLLDALQHAHEQGVWHRDVKPANIIIMNNGKLKVADFGIARIDSSSLTQVGAVMGSPGYMAPEQYKGDAVDWHADIFAAGVLLYQLLTSTRPFTGSTEQLAYKVCYESPAPPSVIAPGRDLERHDAVVAKALSKLPQERYASANEFKAAILEAFAEPVSPTISEETILNEPPRVAGILDPSHPSWQTDRSSGWGRTPVPSSAGGDSVPSSRTIPPRTIPPRSIPPGSSPPGTRPPSQGLPSESYGTVAPTVSASQGSPTGMLAPAQTSRAAMLAWAIAGIAVAVAVGVVAWHAGRESRVPVAPAGLAEPVETRTTELPAPSAPTPSSAGATDAARTEREAAAARRAAEAGAQARAERELAEAKARAERAAAEAKARTERAAAEARQRAAREVAARRAAEAQARADAEQARARAEAERTRTAAAASRSAPSSPPTKPPETPGFFRNEAISFKVAAKLQFNRELFKEEITAKVSGGVVTLTGTVSTQAKRELAGKVVREVAGVLGVNNNLEVAGQ